MPNTATSSAIVTPTMRRRPSRRRIEGSPIASDTMNGTMASQPWTPLFTATIISDGTTM